MSILEKYTTSVVRADGSILTPWFRGAFMNVFTHEKPFGGDTSKAPKYSIVMLFDEDLVDLSGLREQAKKAAAGKWPGKSKGIILPFRDGDEKDYDGYEGMTYARAATQRIIKAADATGAPIFAPEPNEPNPCYSGAYYRALVSYWCNEYQNTKRVLFNVSHVQKLMDGESFGGGAADATVEDVFGGGSDGDNLFG